MESSNLVQRIKKAPKTPGVYIWQDFRHQPLYIGKAANLRSRLMSYKEPTNSRTGAMIKHSHALTWKSTDTDIEALIWESQLIKKYKPKFNVMLRDDKQYFYVEFSNDEFPRIIITHHPIGNAAGPFTDGTTLKSALRYLRRLFPYCTCTRKHHLPCLNSHIDLCPGYCCLKAHAIPAQKKEYAKNIRAIKDVLTGKRATVIRQLAHKSPDVALKLLRIFKNAQIIEKLKARNEKQVGRIEGYDIANIIGKHAVGAMVVFENGIPEKKEYRLFNIKTTGGDTDMLREVLERRIKHANPSTPLRARWPLPDLVVIDGGKAQFNVAQKIFSNHIRIIALTKDIRHHATKITTKEKGKFRERPLAELPLQERNLILAVDAEAHRSAISRYRARHRKTLK